MFFRRSGSSPRKPQGASRKPILFWRAPDFSPGRAEETGENACAMFLLRQLKLAARRGQEFALILAPERKLLAQDARPKTQDFPEWKLPAAAWPLLYQRSMAWKCGFKLG